MTTGRRTQDQLGPRVLALLKSDVRGFPERTLARKLGVSIPALRPVLHAMERDGLAVRQAARWKHPTQPTVPRPRGHGDDGATASPVGYDLVRRFCLFYADIVQELATSKLALEPDEDPRLKMEVTGELDWFQLGKGELRIRRDRLPFVPAPDKGRVTFCGPLHLLEAGRRDRRRMWMPVFLVHARCHREQSAIVFEADTSVQINVDWLDTMFPASDDAARTDFLIQVGLLQEDERGRLRARHPQDLARCVAALRRVFPQDEWVGGRKTGRYGLYDRYLMLQEDLSPYLKGLVEELREMGQAPDEDLARTALPMLAGLSPPQAPTAVDGDAVIACHQPLNPDQKEAIRRAMRDPLTVVQGPPGTGKSTLVRSLLLSQGIAGRSTLFASRNHRALAAVVDPFAPEKEGEPSVIADVRERDWLEVLEQNLASRSLPPNPAPSVNGEGEGQSRRVRPEQDFLERLRGRLAQEAAAEEQLAGSLERVYERRDSLAMVERSLHEMDEETADLAHLVPQLPGATNPEPLLALLSAAGRRPWNPLRWWARFRLRRPLRWLASQPGLPRPPLETLRLVCRRELLMRRRELLEREIRQLSPPTELANAWFERIRAQVALVRESVPSLPAAWAGLVQGREKAIAELRWELRRAKPNKTQNRSDATRLLRKHFPALLEGLPVWAVTNLSLRRRVPFVPGAFDLVVVDEAAQCDPASVLPLLFRARRAVFLGDPMQLPPVSNLGAIREEELRLRHGLDGAEYNRFAAAGRSAWDLARDALSGGAVQPILLREHYRCDPRIAQFFNREFYGGQLVLRTAETGNTPEGVGIRWSHVPGGSTPTRGSRWHEPQVEAIVSELEKLADRGFDGSVGVVTPFREHATRIRDRAYERLGPRRLDNWDFICQTADGFQGGEKDIVLFGLVGGPAPEDTPQFYKRDLQRFNVAISRARLLLHVFGDRGWAHGCGIRLLRDLVKAAGDNESGQGEEVRSDLVGPVWEPLLARRMRAAGLEFRQQYPACGFYLDFALFRSDGARLDVEVDGETYHRGPDGGRLAEDIRRDLILRAQGWTVQRFWVYELREDLDRCLERIAEWTRSAR